MARQGKAPLYAEIPSLRKAHPTRIGKWTRIIAAVRDAVGLMSRQSAVYLVTQAAQQNAMAYTRTCRVSVCLCATQASIQHPGPALRAALDVEAPFAGAVAVGTCHCQLDEFRAAKVSFMASRLPTHGHFGPIHRTCSPGAKCSTFAGGQKSTLIEYK